MWDAVSDSGPNAAKYASSVSPSSLGHYLATANADTAPSQSPHADQSLFKHSSQEHLSMEPNSIINSLKDLSDLEEFATTIEILFDVGCLLHGQNYTYYGNTFTSL